MQPVARRWFQGEPIYDNCQLAPDTPDANPDATDCAAIDTPDAKPDAKIGEDTSDRHSNNIPDHTPARSEFAEN